jgi:restriction endonuclease S subunit
MIFASYLIRLQVIENSVLPEYLFYFTKTQMYWDQVESNSIAVTQPNLNAEKIKDFQIPLPSKEIQEKIVAEIEILEKKESEAKESIENGKEKIKNIITDIKGEYKRIRDLCKYSSRKIDNAILTTQNYIGVDNMLQNMMGKIASNFVPVSGTSTEYNAGDILLSNIRPYLKKIWYADNNGGCSNDVLVLQKTSENDDSKFIFYNLKQDKFFDYEMKVTKGVKMPRGDKQHILDYKIHVPPLPEQQKAVSKIEEIEAQIHDLQKELEQLLNEKELVLNKYL